MLINTQQLSDRLGITPQTLRAQVRKGNIPKPIAIGGSRRRDSDAIDAWLLSKAKEANART